MDILGGTRAFLRDVFCDYSKLMSLFVYPKALDLFTALPSLRDIC